MIRTRRCCLGCGCCPCRRLQWWWAWVQPLSPGCHRPLLAACRHWNHERMSYHTRVHCTCNKPHKIAHIKSIRNFSKLIVFHNDEIYIVAVLYVPIEIIDAGLRFCLRIYIHVEYFWKKKNLRLYGLQWKDVTDDGVWFVDELHISDDFSGHSQHQRLYKLFRQWAIDDVERRWRHGDGVCIAMGTCTTLN